MYYILDDVISKNELLWIYNKILDTPLWTLSNTSTINESIGFSSFPGLSVQEEQIINSKFLSGYFRSTIFRVDTLLRKKYSFKLPKNISRINIGAKSSFSKTVKHVDSHEEDYWTILGFLNPVWDCNNGGEFYLNEEKINYKGGRFIIFPSNIEHDGGFVKNEKLSYWRVAVNIIMKP